MPSTAKREAIRVANCFDCRKPLASPLDAAALASMSAGVRRRYPQEIVAGRVGGRCLCGECAVLYAGRPGYEPAAAQSGG